MCSSGELAVAFDRLAGKMENKSVTEIGHSQGALIWRGLLVKLF
ncbi:MAG: hypothetical protein V4805_07595 [Pseudomonadota bacterium]